MNFIPFQVNHFYNKDSKPIALREKHFQMLSYFHPIIHILPITVLYHKCTQIYKIILTVLFNVDLMLKLVS